MQAHFKQLKPSLEELCEVGNFVIDDLLVVDIVVRLEVDARVSHEQDAFDLDQGKDLFDVDSITDIWSWITGPFLSTVLAGKLCAED